MTCSCSLWGLQQYTPIWQTYYPLRTGRVAWPPSLSLRKISSCPWQSWHSPISCFFSSLWPPSCWPGKLKHGYQRELKVREKLSHLMYTFCIYRYTDCNVHLNLKLGALIQPCQSTKIFSLKHYSDLSFLVILSFLDIQSVQLVKQGCFS